MHQVSDILRDRMHEAEGLPRMAVVSVLGHAAMLAVLIVAQDSLVPQRSDTLREVMSISLTGGGATTDTGGLTAMGGRAVQAETPADVKRPEPVRAPAAKAPEMTVPTKDARRAPQSAAVKQAPEDARGRTPTKGAESIPGSAIAETGARGEGFGLATRSGGLQGNSVTLDVGDFCCPEYITLMIEQINMNWNPRAEVAGEVGMVFTIERDGRLTKIATEKPSPVFVHNTNAQRALTVTRLPGLPARFQNQTLTVHVIFQYTR